MAHPYAGHKEATVGRRRVNKLLHGKEYARGGAAKHDDAAADKQLIKKMLADHDDKVPGKKAGGRIDKYARGGRAKRHGDVNVAVVVPHRSPPSTGSPAAPAGGAGPPPMAPPAPPLAGPPGMGGPPGMPPGLPPGLPMRKRGGKVAGSIPGQSTAENLRRWQDYAKRNSYAAGGATHRYPKIKAGAQSGVGRLELVGDQKGRRK